LTISYNVYFFSSAFLSEALTTVPSGTVLLSFRTVVLLLLSSAVQLKLRVAAAVSQAVICRPLHARYLVSVTATRLAIVAAFLLAALIELPTLWTFDVVTFVCPTSDGDSADVEHYFVLERGLLVADSRLKTAFDALSISLGFLVPLGDST